ncbi:hypothetical protein GCM10023187_17900 [Nibrella viscosa]|uniref:Cell shape determination protein CcmA n=1 Tax=Nibrella viscosa TaxID=1084524 RepID=A0ABP8K9V1_9BACT
MKLHTLTKLAALSLLTVAMGAQLSSCVEDTDGRPQISPGNLEVSKIFPDSAAGNAVVTLQGSGLGDIRTIVFEKQNVPAGFQPTLNTDNALIFRVPTEAVGGVQKVTFTNSAGKSVSVPFRVLAYPTIADASDFIFREGTLVTLTGNNLDDVTKVAVTDTVKKISDAVTIVSKDKRQLVLKMPATTLERGVLSITNGTGTMRTRQEFINAAKAHQIFTDVYGTGYGDGSWGNAGAISTKEFKTGTASVGKTFQKGNWHLLAFTNWGAPLTYSADYTYITGWIKGASADYSLYLTTDAGKGGYGDYNEKNRIDVKANTWTFFKLKLSDIDFWVPGKKLTQMAFRIKGPDKQDETFYFDDIMLVK